MDTHSQYPDDLSELERRLSAWKPASTGLNCDAAMFAAGRASVRPGLARFVWPALTAFLTVLAVGLGVWLADERTERLVLAQQLRQQKPASPSPSPAVAPSQSRPEDDPPPDSFLATHRALEKGLEAWPIRAVVRAETPGSNPLNPPVLRVGTRDVLLDP